MKRFFETIKLSLTSRAFYQRILSGTEPMGFKYFFWLNALYSVILALTFIPAVILLTSPEAHTKVLSVIPADLTLTLEKGKTSINQPEPYMILNTQATSTSERLKAKCGGDAVCLAKIEATPQNVIVIDTKTPFSLEQFNAYSTTILIKDTMLVGKKSNCTVEIIQNPKDINLTLNRAWATGLILKYSWLAYLLPFMVLLGSMTVLYVFSLIGFLLWALLTWGILWVYKVKTSFSKSYSVVLYMSVIFMILDILSLPLPFANNHVVQFIVVLIFLYNMCKQKKNPLIPQTVGDATMITRVADNDTNNGTV